MGMLNLIAGIKAMMFGFRKLFGGQLRRHPHQVGRNAPCLTYAYIQAWLPVLIELELMGHNPIKFLSDDTVTIEKIETHYVAISRAKAKYPEWYKVMAEYVDKYILPSIKVT